MGITKMQASPDSKQSSIDVDHKSTSPSLRRVQAISFRVGLLVLGLVVGLIAAELGARYLLGRPYAEDNGDLWTCDRLMGWRGKSQTSTPINTEGYVHKFVRNSAGMHDGDHALSKEKGVFRILVIGDSFVEARQVEEKETSASILEATLNALAPDQTRYEVVSAGASAWGPAQELMYFRSEGKFYQPDLVLGFWYPANDLMDLLPDHRMTFEGMNCYAPYFAMCDGQFDLDPWFSAPGLAPTQASCSPGKKAAASLLNRLYLNSRLYQHLEPLLMKYQPRVKYAFNFSPWLDRPDPNLTYAYQVMDGIYTDLAREASQAGAKTALVIVPLKEALYYELDQSNRLEIEARYPELKEANPRLPNQKLIELMTARDISVLDLQPLFWAHLKSGGGVLYGDVDSHWNRPGNQLAGELIARWLIEQQLVPVTPAMSAQ